MGRVPHKKKTSFQVAQKVEKREDVEEEQSGRRRSTSRNEENVAKAKQLLNSGRRASARMTAEKLNLLKFSVHSIVSDDLQQRKVCAELAKCAKPRVTLRKGVSGKAQRGNAASASPQSRLGSARLLLPSDERTPEKTPAWDGEKSASGFAAVPK